MQATIITPSEFITMPWKNGLGETIELMVQGANEQDINQGFLWRLSIASVTEDGAFLTLKATNASLPYSKAMASPCIMRGFQATY